ncbi:hypothetical protein C427_2221 [Paraglaciecola psychrophila 170]|uniref:Uncharacterized protein n=1 Tax=Paraglaciecola psychrophila 170 TaxID=1129794 RepID=M4RL31_9ALTE|nr:hypothetical protein C427_2221 [Paraglaciecola psychrophila 170]
MPSNSKDKSIGFADFNLWWLRHCSFRTKMLFWWEVTGCHFSDGWKDTFVATL